MALSKVTNYQLALVKGRYSYRFMHASAGNNWSPWEGVITADLVAIASIFGTNNAFFDAQAQAFIAGPSGGPSFERALTFPLIEKKARSVNKNLKTKKAK